MNRILKIVVVTILSLYATACMREELSENEMYVGEEEVLATLKFSHKDFDVVNITTRATLDLIPESRVQNLFVYIFVGEKRVYAHYFDRDDLVENQAEVEQSEDNCWYISNRSSNVPTDQETTGYMRIKAPTFSGGDIYLVANIDADMVNISPEKLNTVRTRADIDNLTASLNQLITSRNGYFPMSCRTTIDIADDGRVTLGSPISLTRLDAKIKVGVRVATDNELVINTEDGETETQTLKEFIPESWRVVNIPQGSYVFDKTSDYDASGYFSTDPVVFETKTVHTFTYTDSKGDSHEVDSPVNGFSFYMLENREKYKKSVEGNYHLRDKRVKDASGQYTKTGDKWVYAPEDATYLEIKGEVIMTVDVSSEAKQQQLSAAVTYYIHLGDFFNSQTDGVTALDNYSINRNTIYNYIITIKGVNEIETEVTTSNLSGVGPNDPGFEENETGATGQVYIAKESIYTFDAHYGQRVFCFDAAYIDPDNVTWYVKTPFGKEGVPEKVGDTEVPAGMDYKWVHFLLNSVEADGTYSHKNLPWPGDPYDDEEYSYYKDLYNNDAIDEDLLMDVVEFTQLIKEEKRKFERNHDDNPDNDVEASKFLKEYDDDWRVWYNEKNGISISESDAKALTGDEYPWWRYRMYVTVFVDEFYYEVDPISGEAREGLWKEFVNQPNRLMHILCDNEKSFDRESSATGSVITLRQRSIQTPYNLEHAETAWGCETVDEFQDSDMWYFSQNENNSTGLHYDYPNVIPNALGSTSLNNKGNNSPTNGLSNTAKLLGLTFENQDIDKWTEYVDYSRTNDYKDGDYVIFFMKDGYKSLLYSLLLRNRDNNGNGFVDPDELRWYQSALEQVYGLYLGGLGLSAEAQLYPPDVAEAVGKFDSGNYEGTNKWMLKVVSSTCTSLHPFLPVAVWAEEGVSISYYKREYQDWPKATNWSPYSIRCSRNLGLFIAEKESIMSPGPTDEPEPLIITDISADRCRFDLRNINKKSVRFYTTQELEPGDENSEMARLYYGLETGIETSVSSTGYPMAYDALKAMLEKGDSPCPKDWRTPNVREGALLYLYAPNDWWNDGKTMVNTWTSLGEYGSQRKFQDGYYRRSWVFGNDFATIGDYDSSHIRCVKDSDPATW